MTEVLCTFLAAPVEWEAPPHPPFDHPLHDKGTDKDSGKAIAGITLASRCPGRVMMVPGDRTALVSATVKKKKKKNIPMIVIDIASTRMAHPARAWGGANTEPTIAGFAPRHEETTKA